MVRFNAVLISKSLRRKNIAPNSKTVAEKTLRRAIAEVNIAPKILSLLLSITIF